MDVAPGQADVQVLKELKYLLVALTLGLLVSISAAHAIGEAQSPIHSSGDKQLWDRKTNRVELIGNARVQQPGEILTADYILLDKNARTLDARGNCVYISTGNVIYGEEMHFNLDTRTGTIVQGRVSNEGFTLAGERINKLGEGRFQTHWGEYSTCRDCAQSWTLQARDVDLEVEGYAYMTEVTGKIKDTPAFWLPYMVVPMKTRRQSGFLFPVFGYSGTNGFMFVVPYFWAINRSSDMTIALGNWSEKGRRAELEGRYRLSDTSSGVFRGFYVKDPKFEVRPNRWALDFSQAQDLPFGIQQKLRYVEMSDNLYPRDIGDVPGGAELVSASDLIFNYPAQDFSTYVALRRFRNLLNVDPDPNQRKVEFDGKTVQVYPTAAVATNDHLFLGSKVGTSVVAQFTNFARSADAFDYDPNRGSADLNYIPGVDPLRKATRVALVPSLYTAFRPWDVLSLVPSLQYRMFAYSFSQPEIATTTVPALYRSYPLLQLDSSMQFERVYEFKDDPAVPLAKHLIRPMLTYSYIPEKLIHQDENHPFSQQIERFDSYKFDNYDVVPLDYRNEITNSYVPLGNSISYGLTTQWIRRYGVIGNPDAAYQRTVEFSAGQAFNFRALDETDPAKHRPLNRFFSNLRLDLGRFNSVTDYYYFPYIAGYRHRITTNMNYVLESSIRQRLLTFNRTFNLGYTWNEVGYCSDGSPCSNPTQPRTQSIHYGIAYSINDYVTPSVAEEFTLLTPAERINTVFNLLFQSPSQCWRLNLSVPYIRGTGWSFKFDLSINLTGSGFGGITDFAAQAASREGRAE